MLSGLLREVSKSQSWMQSKELWNVYNDTMYIYDLWIWVLCNIFLFLFQSLTQKIAQLLSFDWTEKVGEEHSWKRVAIC